MFRKFSLFAIVSLVAVGVSSYTLTEKPKKKTSPTAKKAKTEVKNEVETPGVIKWYDMTTGYAKAVKENKILIVDVYTDWCGWCKVMDKETYDNSEIVNIIKQHAVAVKFNPEKNDKHIVGTDTMSSQQLTRYLANGARISGYPTTFIWKGLSNTKNIKTYAGYLDVNNMKEVLNTSINE